MAVAVHGTASGCLRPGAFGRCRRPRRIPRAGEQGQASEVDTFIEGAVQENKIVLFMKGNKLFPQCGFSNACVRVLDELQVPYKDVDVLSDNRLRERLKTYSNWPTFPQLYLDGELFGGCDIVLEAYQDGSLQEEVERALME